MREINEAQPISKKTLNRKKNLLKSRKIANCKEMCVKVENRTIGKVEPEDLAFYETQFQGMLWANSPEMIENDSLDHAIVLIKCLIGSAQKNIKVFCRALAADVWGRTEIVHAVKTALARGVVFKVAVQDSPEDSETKKILTADDSTSSELRMFPVSGKYANFLLVDDKSFRFEPDPALRKGFAYVYAPESANKLKKIFDNIWTLTRPCPN